MLSSNRSTLAQVLARPPTPPLDTDESIEHAIAFLSSDIETGKGHPLSSSQPISSTPPNSSPLRPTTLISNVSTVKRVEFLSTPTFHPPPHSTLEASSPKSSPARSKLLRPGKSILKLGSVSPLPTPEDSDSQSLSLGQLPRSFARMLDFTLKQLESSSHYERLDAYLALNGALTTHDDMPSHQELSRHMNAFQRLVLRDTAFRELDETTDVQITVQAFKLAARVLAYDDFLRSTDVDFQTSMLDRAVAVIEHSSLPKTIVKCVLGLLAQQDLPSTVLTSTRIERILTALQTIDSRCQGNSVVAIRITIYRRLMRQGPNVMLLRMRDWLQHMLNGMLSDIADVRTRAIEACNHAGIEFGSNTSATKALHDLLEVETEDGTSRYFEHFTLRLAHFTKSESVRSSVPSIWSALILFHRSPKMPLHNWRRWKSWLTIMQPCLCSSDTELRSQAHYAWRRLVYVVRPDASMSATLVTLLMRPMRAGFERKGADKRSKELRRLALDGYYNLLHYALRPDLSFDNLDFAWNNFVVDTVRVMASASNKGRMYASRILRGLFTPNSGVWNPAAALENSSILPEDLPRLDVRWVRSRLSQILPLIDLVLPSMLESPVVDQYTLALDMWSSLIEAVVQAGAQEVRLSTDLKTAMVHILNSFRRLTVQSLRSEHSRDEVVIQERLLQLQTTTFTRLGLAHFLEDFITLSASTKEATLVRSPSISQQGAVSAMTFVLSYIATAPPHFIRGILLLMCSTKSSNPAKVQLLFKSWQSLSLKEDCISGSINATWAAIAEMLASLIRPQDHVTTSGTPEALQGLSACRAILMASFNLVDVDANTLAAVDSLTSSSILLAKSIAGEAGPVLALVEPLNKPLVTEQKTYNLQVVEQFLRTTLRNITWPRHPQAEEQAIKTLLGVTGVHKSKSMTFENFLKLLNQVLCSCYEQGFSTETTFAVDEDLQLLCGFASAADCPGVIFEYLRPGVSLWVADSRKHLTNMSEAARQGLIHSWSRLLSLLIKDAAGLRTQLVQMLFTAGFRSTSKDFVTDTIKLWNDTFEANEDLECIEELQHVLRALDAFAFVKMPRLTIPEDAPVVKLPTHQEQDNALSTPPMPQKVSTPKGRPSAQRVGFSEKVETPTSQPTSRARSKKLFKSPRIHHNDSQIEFTVVEQLPTLQAQDSQLFTENQREVRDRQHDDVMQYPELSSSPIPFSHGMKTVQSYAERQHTMEATAPADIDMLEIQIASSPAPDQPTSTSIKDSTVVVSSDAPLTDAQISAEREGSSVLDTGDIQNESMDFVIETSDDRSSPENDLPNIQLQLEAEMAASLESSPLKARRATDTESYSYVSSSQPSKTSRKRKRGKADNKAEKSFRRKTTDDVLRFDSQDQDDMEDCIVVASSQQWVQSQATPEPKAGVTGGAEVNDTLLSGDAEVNDTLSSGEAQVNATPSSGEVEVNATPSSRTHEASTTNSDPPPSRSGKRRRRRSRRIQASQDDSPSLDRSSALVQVPGTDEESLSIQKHAQNEETEQTPEQSNSTNVVEQTDIEVVNEGEITTPSKDTNMGAAGILSLLKEALDGFKTSSFGQKEEREIDNMLFELRLANHEAARRSKEIMKLDEQR